MADVSIFLPKTIIKLVSENNNTDPVLTEEGTILFCDVAGFTPLTETLSKMGKEGSEELTKILNSYFTEMIEIIEELGGDVLRFGGDAMTVVFPGGLEENALSASRTMMKKMDKFSEIKVGNLTFSLAMKIGVSYGMTTLGILGNDDVGKDYYAAGMPLDESAEAEHKASKGEVVIHPAFLERFSPDVIPIEDGFAKIRMDDGCRHKLTVRKGEPAALSGIENLVPRYLVDRAGEGTLGEHRGTTVIFLGFEGIRPGVDKGSCAVFHEKLNGFYVHLASTCKNYGGIVNKMDMGDKGMKSILLFGSPYALENKEEMAIRCALETRDQNPVSEAISMKMGITSSALFTGPVGSLKRREFTVMGDGINTAARLMQKASRNDIYCDEKTMEVTKGSVAYKALEPLSLKGKAKAVPVFVPEGFSKKEERFDLPVIIERDCALEKIKNLLLGKAGPILITGGPGLGKTVLIEWTRKESLTLNLLTTRVFLAPYHKTRSYSLWKGALRSLIGAQKNESQENVRRLRDSLLDKESKPYGALLNPILGIEEEDNDNLRSLSPREKKELTFAIAEKIFLRGGERVILADNLEMADPLSLELLHFLFQGSSELSLKFVASCRSISPDIARIAGNFDKLDLSLFSENGLRDHLVSNIRLENVSRTLLDWFYAKTTGNPKLISAIVQILIDNKIISKESGGYTVDEDRLFATPFPERLEDIYLKKIDELPREEREIVQMASVLGYSVSLFLLSYAAEIDKGEVKKIAEKLIQKGIVRSDSWGERPYLKFTDSLLKDAVYNALPFAMKRDVHLKCALFLEKEGADKTGLFPIIASHFSGAGDRDKANIYNKKSAFDALSRFDNLTAMRFLEEVCEGAISKDNLECGFSLMEVYGNLGRAEEERALISRIETLEEMLDCRERLRFLSFETKKSIMERNFTKAEELFILAEKLAEEIKDNLALAKIYVNMVGGLYGPKGEFDKAQAALEKCLALPESKESAIFKVTALFNSANIMKHKGQDEMALTTFKQSYKKASRLKLLPQMANIAGSIANLLYERADYKNALSWARRTRKWAETFSLRQLILFNDYIQSVIEHMLGNSEKAGERLKKNIENSKRFNNSYVLAISSQAMIDVGFSLLKMRDALEYGKNALDTSRNIKASRTFRYTLVEVIRLFESFAAKEEARQFLSEGRYLEFLKETPASATIEPLLEAYFSWISDSGKEFSKDDLDALSPDLKMDYIFFFVRDALERNDLEAQKMLMETAFRTISSSPSISFKIKLYFFTLRSGIPCPAEFQGEVNRILRKKPSGVCGLRALALMWPDEKSPTLKRKIRWQLISGMYNFKAGSPVWAFEKFYHLPEIKEVFVGEV